MMRSLLRLGVVAATLCAFAPAAYAQVNTQQSGTYGQVSLRTGFEPDPHSVTVTAGGNIDASRVSNECNGHVANRADFTLRYTAGSTFPLIISTTSEADTTLLVRAPNGSWSCNDDGGSSLNAVVRFDHPQSGRYQIWVGTFGDETAPATLNISEVTTGDETSASGEAPDISLPPTYGAVSLRSGFTPDPYNANLTAGGGLDASNADQNCNGHIASAPDYQLNWTAGSGALPLIISATSDADTTLVINDAQGHWICNDDTDGLNPAVRIDNPASGRYDIYVGTFAEDTAPATLHISEIQSGGPSGGGGSGDNGQPDFSANPTYGSVNLRAGFNPDPYTHAITAGGSLNASSVGSQCVGHIARAPDFRVNWTAGSGSRPLIFSVNSSADTTLVVNDAQGQWLCDDDGGNGGLNPAITIAHPASGQYDVWVGTFGDNTAPSTLNVSELYSQ